MPRSPGSAWRRCAASAAHPGLRPGAAAPRHRARGAAHRARALVGRHAGVGRARAGARRLRRGARAALRRLPRRPAGDRAAAIASCTTRRRSTRCAWSPRAGARRRSSSTASTTSARSSATRSRRWPSTRARRSPSRWPTSPGARPSPGAARPSRSSWRSAPSTSSCRRSPSTTRAPRCTRSSARCSSRPRPGAPIPGDALLLLEGGGERAEIELVAAHVARLIGERAFAPEDVAVVLREPREHAALLEQVFGELEIPYALDRTIAAGHTALGRGLVALLRCALASGSADDLLAWLRTPGKLARPDLADRLEQRARVEGAATAAQARGAVGGRPPRLRPARARSRRGGGGRPGRAVPAPGRRVRRALRRSRIAARRGCWPAPRRSTRASPARCARRWASSSAWRPSTARSCPAPERARARPARPRGARPRRPAPRARGHHEPARAARPARARGLPVRPARGRLPAPGHARAVPGRRRAPRAQRRLRAAPAPARGPPRRRALPALRGGQPPDRAARAQLARRRRRGRAVRALAVRRRRPRQLRPARRRARGAPRPGGGRLRGRAGADRERGGAPRPRGGPGLARAARWRRCATPRVLRNLDERATWSASALESYASCPVKWFVERLLRPAALEPDPEPMLRGDLAHRVLEDTLRALSDGGPLTPERLDEARALLRAALDARADDARISPNPERRRSALRRLEADLLRYVEQAARGQSAFAPREFELRFGGPEDPLGPAELAGGELRLQGRIDRIDVSAGGGEAIVYDYKGKGAPPQARWIEDAQPAGRALPARAAAAARPRGRRRALPAAGPRRRRAPARACCSTAPTPASRAWRRTAWRPRSSRRSCRRSSTRRCRRCAASARARWSPTRPRARTAAAARTRPSAAARRPRRDPRLHPRAARGHRAPRRATSCSRPTPARARRPCWSSASSPRWCRTACAPTRSWPSPSPRRRRASCARACAPACSSSATARRRARPRPRGSRPSTASARGSCARTRSPPASTPASRCSTPPTGAPRSARPSRPRWPTSWPRRAPTRSTSRPATRVDRLQRMVVAAHDELRSRGQTRPDPAAAARPADPDAARAALDRACAAFAAELAGAGAGAAVDAAREALDGLPRGARRRRGRRIRRAAKVGRNANALKTPAADAYRAALRGARRARSPIASPSRRWRSSTSCWGATPTPTRRPSAPAAASTSTTSSCSRATCSSASPGIAAGYRERFERIMVDEFQDTNALQLELLELVARDNACTVGDELQAIYAFRHADVEVFRARRERLEAAGRTATLATNFRSRPEILRALNGAFGAAARALGRPAPGARRRTRARAGGRAAGHRRRRLERRRARRARPRAAGRERGQAGRGAARGPARRRARARRGRRAARRRRAAARLGRDGPLRARAGAGRAADAGGRRQRMVGAPADPRPVPPAGRAGQPARRGGAARAAGLADGGPVLRRPGPARARRRARAP